MKKIITEKLLKRYREYLYEQERSTATIKKYMCDLRKLVNFAAGRELNKVLVIEYKDFLKTKKEYRTSSINSFLVAANRFFEYMEWYELKVKAFAVQKKAFLPEERELSKLEYKRLVNTALRMKKVKIAMIVQTICATGIRVGELSAVTVKSVERGIITIYNKGKERQVLLSRNLQVKLLQYVRKINIKHGPVFRTSKGNPVDRSWIWREMKKLCEEANVDKNKVFPHNLRHLFAKTYYKLYHDLAKLADILGHSNMETTRIYIRESCKEHRKQLEVMDLLVGERST